jgi:hypothetical protein
MSTRSVNPSLAIAEETTPEPSSTVLQAGAIEEIPEDLQSDPFVQYMMAPPAEDIANVDALSDAGELYGDDPARALADLLVGRHPLQRSSAPSR